MRAVRAVGAFEYVKIKERASRIFGLFILLFVLFYDFRDTLCILPKITCKRTSIRQTEERLVLRARWIILRVHWLVHGGRLVHVHGALP